MRTGPLTNGMATLPKLSAESVVAPGLSVKVVLGAKTPGEYRYSDCPPIAAVPRLASVTLIPILESAGPARLEATGTPRSVALPTPCMLSAARFPSVPAHTRPPATVMPYVLTEGNVVVRMP